MKIFLTYILVGFLWLLHWLPLSVLRSLGRGLGRLLYALGRSRREVALTNLRLCFPEKSEAEREALARAHFVAFARAVLDRTLGWWASRQRLERIIRIHGVEHLTDPDGRPVVMLSPHFVGLDAGGTVVSMHVTGCSVFSNQKNPVLNKLLYDGRMRFNEAILLSRQDGMRKIVRAMKDGHPFYYLPDMDFGPKESIFVPFFGVQAATIPALSRLVRLTNARVVPVICHQVPDGYDIEVMPPWENFPGESIEADTEFMNKFIESQVLRMPEQYFWLHKRFKTRPPGEQRFYQ
ncbi:MAG: lysophospholipid acyltransferase family protein [Gammaproteobacteria bacterium]|nr:lysophospholipid acyltransferase family protein [Gammaproteobacteria bacterium]MBU1600660.1 lysophospholipid acyltransferase family protein [Gammaproteobacteria bacterium]MBU2435116.1 lysophospholipid acyltransferase family protein [Gammaproteobacteria bacterium]MBU2448352.1 lysophospholipid acyltransferase family protein [Gammaproteobacteria bacterium]